MTSSRMWESVVPAVPRSDCLEDLWDLVDRRLADADLDEDDPDSELLAYLVLEVDECEHWPFGGQRTPAPQFTGAPLAARVFGRDSDIASWVGMIFAGIAAKT